MGLLLVLGCLAGCMALASAGGRASESWAEEEGAYVYLAQSQDTDW